MTRITHVMIASALALTPAVAQDSEPQVVLPVVNAADVTLTEFQWTARPLVVFADSPVDPRFGEQIELLHDLPEDLVERGVVVITDTDPAAQGAIRTELRPRGFMLALLAKDGSVVFRKPLPC